MKLNEIKISLLDKKTIGEKLRKYGLNPVSGITIDTDGTVDVEKEVWIESLDRYDEIKQSNTGGWERKILPFEKFDVQFGTCSKSFRLSQCSNLISIKGCPTRVEGSFTLYDCPGIKSLEHAPAWIGGDCVLNKLPSITDFGSIKYVGGRLTFFDTSIVNILQVFKIKGVKSIHCGSSILDGFVNKYLPTRDVIGCQDEMIAAGWEGYARTK
jgi:hypothetical protein